MKYLVMLFAGLLLHVAAHTQGCTVNYVDPSFQLQKTDPSCTPNTGRIEAINESGGVAPFTFTLVETNTTNSTGIFSNLAPGAYTVELRDACGTVRTRQVTLVPWSFSFTFVVNKTNTCSDGEVVITTTPSSGTFQYAVVKERDTTWSNSSTIATKLYKRMIILVKDACGNVQTQVWNAPFQFLPYIDALQYRLQCDKFDLFPVYWGFVNPHVCLYEFGSNTLIACKDGTGNYNGGPSTNFYDIPWGAYYVIVSDSCFRDSMYHPDMRSAGGSELNPYNWDCTSFTMHVDGMEDTVCLYNAVTNQLISCKGQDTVSINPRTGRPWPSGAVWDSLPYGSYYAWIYDPCTDSTFKIDSTVSYPFTTYANAFPGCTLNQTTIQATFSANAKRPFTIDVFNANGTLNSTFVTNNYDNYLAVTPPSSGGQLTVVSYDGCNKADTAVVTPAITAMAKSISVDNKCPGISGSSGSGDVHVFASTYTSVAPTPQIIKKNWVDTIVNYSFRANDTFDFPNLLSGTYVVKYSFTSCSSLVVYDTIVIQDYVYPTQTADTAIQCGGNEFRFTFPIVGGLNPYTFQIIGSTPALPSLAGSTQALPTFTVANGQHYTSVKVRAIDRCGNSTIGDVTIQPLNGCSTLEVDSVRNNPALANSLARVYPNPSGAQFTVAISQKKKSNYRIRIVNASGVQLYDRQLAGIDKKEVVINEAFVPGLYIINVIDLQSGRSSVFKQIIR